MTPDFILHVTESGYRVNGPVLADGKIHRVNWKPDSGGIRAGWYIAYDHGDFKAVVWGDWRDAMRAVWTSKSDKRMTVSERAILKSTLESARAAEAKKRAILSAIAERNADRIWSDGDFEAEPHAYLSRKGIPGTFMRAGDHRDRETGRITRNLLIPLRDTDGFLKTLQQISETGEKKFVKNGPVAGLSWRCGPARADESTEDIYIAEGAATAATVRELANGATVYACMNSGNLPAIAELLYAKYPGSRIIIAADDDRWEKNGSPRPRTKNAGILKAEQAALTTRALIIVPTWNDLANKGTDWNDLWLSEGEQSCRKKWRQALEVASLDRRIGILQTHEFNRDRKKLIEAYEAAGAGKMTAKQLDERRKGNGGQVSEPSADEDRPDIVVLRDICEEADLFEDQYGNPCATFELNGVIQTAKIGSTVFEDWLRLRFDQEAGTRIPPSPLSIDSTRKQSASRARNSDQRDVFYRMGRSQDPTTKENWFWLDLGRRDWTMVKWNGQGWSIAKSGEAKFTHSDGKAALPIPGKIDGLNGLDPLWELLRVQLEDRCVVAGFLLGAMAPDTPSFGLNIFGVQGSAKSIATEFIRNLLDPQGTVMQPINDKEGQNIAITAISQWIPCFENTSSIPPAIQDILCSLTTKLGAKTRKLYSDNETVSFEVRRPWIVNGINNLLTRNDVLERSIPLELLPAPKADRKFEEDLRETFRQVRPHIMAVLLDAAVAAVAGRQETQEWMREKGINHRMADSLRWITAGEETLGFPMGSFHTRLTQLQAEAGYGTLEGDPMLGVINELLDGGTMRGSPDQWKGTNSDLFNKLQDTPSIRNYKHAPQTPEGVGRWLNREAERLRNSFGIEVGKKTRSRDGDSRASVRLIYRTRKVTSLPDHPPEDDDIHPYDNPHRHPGTVAPPLVPPLF